MELRHKLLEKLEHAQAVLVRPNRVPLPHTMIAWDSSHYLATLNSIEVARPMVAERVVAKELWAMLLYGFLQGSPVDIVEAVLEIDLLEMLRNNMWAQRDDIASHVFSLERLR